MKTFELKRGLNVPVTGAPQRIIEDGGPVKTVALVGDDYIGMKPTMEVAEGDRVQTGQLVFTDKKTPGIKYTSPATGTIRAINRGAKRKFETLVVEVEDDEHIAFLDPAKTSISSLDSDAVRAILQQSGMWCSFRTRPYGKIPPIDTSPAALFITAMDSRPLAGDPAVIINLYKEAFSRGLEILTRLVSTSIYLCRRAGEELGVDVPGTVEIVGFEGPHPAGLASTHIHMLDQAREDRIIWHINFQDVIGIGHLFTTGELPTEKIIALAGPAVKDPKLIKTRPGANIEQICSNRLAPAPLRVLSGSILDGREADEFHGFLGRYHNQISALPDKSGRGLFSWGTPGSDRFSIKPIFTSAMNRAKSFAMNTALWGGQRAIYPIDSYDRVMPLDIIPMALLKCLAKCDTEKARSLGALELIEEDLALLSFVCPGKNNFGPMLRRVLTEIELEG
ncbi:MAG: Na(+)-translocating NADH-quinone reductase subunit A [Desulfopila sp.]